MSDPIGHSAARCNLIPAEAGIGLRPAHFEDVVQAGPDIAWMEIHSENYLGGGAPLAYLDRIRADYPISMHGVGLSLGSAAGLDARHLERLRKLEQRIQPGFVSEHLSWSVADGIYFNDLLPLPYTDETLDIVARNVDAAQTALGRSILVENASTYMQFAHSHIPEHEFMEALARRSGCRILLDVNNVYVNACNHGLDAEAYLDAIPADLVGEIHLAGHAINHYGDREIRIDDHGSRVSGAVWTLYERVIERIGRRPSLIEWDTEIPALDVLLDEAKLAAARLDHLAGPASGHGHHADAA